MGNISKHFSGSAQRQKLNEGPKSKALEVAGRIGRKALRPGPEHIAGTNTDVAKAAWNKYKGLVDFSTKATTNIPVPTTSEAGKMVGGGLKGAIAGGARGGITGGALGGLMAGPGGAASGAVSGFNLGSRAGQVKGAFEATPLRTNPNSFWNWVGKTSQKPVPNWAQGLSGKIEDSAGKFAKTSRGKKALGMVNRTNIGEAKEARKPGTKAGGSTFNPLSSRMFGDQRIRQSKADTPKTAAGRFGLNFGRAAGATGLSGAITAGTTLAGAAAGAVPGTVLGALAGKPGMGAGIGALAGGAAGMVKGVPYAYRKGTALGGRSARYIATGSTKRPSEMKEESKKQRDLGRGPAAIGGALAGVGVGAVASHFLPKPYIKLTQVKS